MTEEPLYKDEKLKIDYLDGCHDHELFIGENSYPIQRGILAELARTPRGGIERIIQTWNSNIFYGLEQAQISVDGLHVAICQAYAEEERRIDLFIREHPIRQLIPQSLNPKRL